MRVTNESVVKRDICTFKAGETLASILVSPKEKDTITKKSSDIYSFNCGKLECEVGLYRGVIQKLGERCKEHLKQPSSIFEHQSTTSYIITVANFKIIGREGHNMAKGHKRGYIHKNDQLYKNIGKYNLPCIWDKILLSIPELKISNK